MVVGHLTDAGPACLSSAFMKSLPTVLRNYFLAGLAFATGMVLDAAIGLARWVKMQDGLVNERCLFVEPGLLHMTAGPSICPGKTVSGLSSSG